MEHMYGKDVDSMWAVLCALEGRPSNEEELQKIRQGVATRVESRHMWGAMEKCLPRDEVWWQKYIQRTRGGPAEVEAWAAEGGYKVAVYRGTKTGKENGNRWNVGTEPHWMQESCGPGEESTRFFGGSGVPGLKPMRCRPRCKAY